LTQNRNLRKYANAKLADKMNGKKIILGVTGSIAAYKAAFLVRALIRRGAEVQVVMTPAAKEFITPLTMATLSRKPVVSEFFSSRDGSWNSHVELGLWADAMLVAPATASTIAKMANGVADNMLVTTYLSCKAPVFVAPAMDLDMYAHATTQQNLARLQSFGNHIIEPEAGELASQLTGKGRMAEPDAIVAVLDDFFASQNSLRKKKVLITAGPTYEKIDPVRFIGNCSSGKMGFAIAETFAKRGATVHLVAGPVHLQAAHPNIRRTDVESAEEMYSAAVESFADADIAVLCAAVADYRPENRLNEKMKRENSEQIMLSLVRNRDIAATLGKAKRDGQLLVGFALETNDGLRNAISKMERKSLDMIVLNSLEDEGAGFGSDTNKVTLICRDGDVSGLPLMSKTQTAEEIVKKIVTMIK